MKKLYPVSSVVFGFIQRGIRVFNKAVKGILTVRNTCRDTYANGKPEIGIFVKTFRL